MKVLQVIGQLGHGGAETMCARQAAWLHDQGIDVSVFVLQRRGNAVEEQLAAAGVRVVFAARRVHSFSGFARLRAELRGTAYDLVHAHLFPSLYWVALLGGGARRAGAAPAFVYTEHSTGNRRRRWPLQALERLVYRRYDAVVCISAASRQALAAWQPELAPRLHLIPNGVELERFRGAAALPRPELRLGEGDRVVLMVGAFRREKNQAGLLRALALLPPQYCLVLVGDGPERGGCERLARQLGVQRRVRFAGLRNDVERLLRLADVYVLPSLFEGFGLSCVEAMAAGVPVVAAAVPGLQDIVGGAGRPCDPASPADIAQQIAAVCNDAALRSRLVAAGAAVAERYRERASFERTLQLYQALAKTA